MPAKRLDFQFEIKNIKGREQTLPLEKIR